MKNKKYTKEDAEKGFEFAIFCTKKGNEGYLRAFYHWLKNERLTQKRFNKTAYSTIQNLMIEYVAKGLSTKTTDDKTLITDDELIFFQSKD